MQLLVQFVATNPTQIVAFGVKETGVKQLFAPCYGGGFTRTEFAVQLHQSFFFAELSFFLDRLLEVFGMAQTVVDFAVGESEGF